MGSFTCTCGHVIPDSGETCQDAGVYWSDVTWQAHSDAVARDIGDYFVASKAGRAQEWLASHGLADCKSDEEAVSDILTFHDQGRSVYICPQCARLHLQRNWGENDYTPYTVA